MLVLVLEVTDNMLLAGYRRINKTDYAPDNQDLVEQLATSINYGFDTLFEALNGKLDFKNNFASTITEFTVSVDSDGVPLQKTQFKLKDGQMNVEGLVVLNVSGNEYPTGGVFISFTKQVNFININNIKGLEPEISYTIKVLALG